MKVSVSTVTSQILEVRRQIDRLDRQIAQLCAERAKKSDFILKNKLKHNISKKDEQREQKILKNYIKKIKARHADISEKSVKDLVRSLIRLAPNYKKAEPKKRKILWKTNSRHLD